MSLVTFAETDAVGVIVVNNPPLNLLNAKVMDDLGIALDAAEKSSARSVLVRAEGRHFGAGADAGDMFAGVGSAEARLQLAVWVRTLRRLEALPVPVIAAVQGSCIGGSLELALYCDIIVAGASARFSHPEANLGTATLFGGAQRIAERAGPVRARWFVYGAGTYDAATCEGWGIVGRVVEDDRLAESASALAAEIAAGPTRAHSMTKQLIRAYRDEGMQAADKLLLDLAPSIYDTADMQHGVAVLMEHGARALQTRTTFVGR